MFNDGLIVHFTTTRKIEGEGTTWEFVCDRCGYRARYSLGANGIKKLDVLQAGAANARHMSDFVLPSLNPHGVAHHEKSPDDAEDDLENWLTPEIRAQLEEILKGF